MRGRRDRGGAAALLWVVVLATSAAAVSRAQLQVGFYDTLCPAAEIIIQEEVSKAASGSPGIAAGLLRLHFHDCFVRVDLPSSGPTATWALTHALIGGVQPNEAAGGPPSHSANIRERWGPGHGDASTVAASPNRETLPIGKALPATGSAAGVASAQPLHRPSLPVRRAPPTNAIAYARPDGTKKEKSWVLMTQEVMSVSSQRPLLEELCSL